MLNLKMHAVKFVVLPLKDDKM